MNAFLFVSQLLIPTIPADFTVNSYTKEAIASFSCVAAVEEDSIVHTLALSKGDKPVTKTLIVTVKEDEDTRACAESVTTEFGGRVTLDSVLSSIGMFIVSYEIPAEEVSTQPSKPAGEQPIQCLAIDGICG